MNMCLCVIASQMFVEWKKEGTVGFVVGFFDMPPIMLWNTQIQIYF